MVLQPTFASLAYDTKRKKTRREKFLGEMDEVMPWEELVKLVGGLSEGRERAAADAAGVDVADLLPAAVVRPL